MILPKAKPEYVASDEQAFRDILIKEDDRNVKKGADIRLTRGRSTERMPRLIIQSPDGSLWALEIDNAGVISWSPTT